MGEFALVSVIVPCRNEALYLEDCLRSIAASDYPKERIEVLVVDGRSSDESRRIAGRHGAPSRIIDNPSGATPAALNLGIAEARGEIVIRVDARCRIAPDYVSKCVELLSLSGAANVGGVITTESKSRAVSLALSHPFGVGPSPSRVGGPGVRPVDTVYGGCWRRTTLERIGGFNERLARGQDMELNRRLNRAGGTILISPEIRSAYIAPDGIGALLRKRWLDGAWAVLAFRHAHQPVRSRHLAPMAFVALATAIPVLAAAYGAVAVLATIFLVLRERNLSLGPLLLVAFVGSHLAYGFGSWWGLAKLLFGEEGLLGVGAWRERRIQWFRT